MAYLYTYIHTYIQVLPIARDMAGDKLTELIEERRLAFSKRFDTVFDLKNKKCQPSSWKKKKKELKYPACVGMYMYVYVCMYVCMYV
jgi:hypothetical protein